MAAKKVVTKGGGDNLFKINISGNKHYVKLVKVGFINSYIDIGETRSLEDALSLIRSYSGNEIDKITDW